jgi:hypothetical protein
MHIDTDALLFWRPPARGFQKFQRQGPVPGRIDNEIGLKCLQFTVRCSKTDIRGGTGARFTDDTKNPTSAPHFDVPQSLHLPAQSPLKQWSGHTVGCIVEFNSRPSILSRELIQKIKASIDGHCSSLPQFVAEAGKELL